MKRKRPGRPTRITPTDAERRQIERRWLERERDMLLKKIAELEAEIQKTKEAQ